ncbi:hypothetical protein V6N12_014369 [Hibiscus sabdariffa]|uniref:Secreted protein n=1 Tax=Hibiscus sabdariffa TaxID=183260 RepID=A0ABR2DJY7_9ROSI
MVSWGYVFRMSITVSRLIRRWIWSVQTVDSANALLVNGNNVRSHAAADVVSTVATPVVVPPTLPSFRDMIVRQSTHNQRDN